MKLSRLPGRKENEYVRSRGNVWKGKTMTIKWLSGAPKTSAINPEKAAIYVGTGASVKLHKSAVKRNRMRRRCREALRLAVNDQKKGSPLRLLISPKAASLHCDYADIKNDVEAFLSHVL